MEAIVLVCAGFGCGIVLGCLALHAAYRNGVTDGYGYSREPNCPGYAKAGEYLRNHMAHRWPELRPGDCIDRQVSPPTGGSGIVRLPKRNIP
jgi:hypothetical protein